ncbi:G2/M phase-specific E3 ubiquitin-protein ligase [Merluccius polli]|uniref:G2/M phase-specific E3 ubiquitin-protein ligase n=1 Tax=Merluccius polli TaxID=89951 RepID=A0AA47P5Z4_MERPO|nr:G2/M phase-specific E3 ubiquitin-protein ligase [Merluccius polli]
MDMVSNNTQCGVECLHHRGKTLSPVYLEEDEAPVEAIQSSLLEDCDMLYVTFASDEHDAEEDAADLGGPRREFFRLLVKAIFQDSGAFEGTPNGCTPRLNILHLQNGVYRTIGRMMSTIIVQGGEPPAFLSPSVVDYIVQHANLQDDLEKAVSCCDWRYQVEGLPLVVTMANRDVFVKNAVLYHTVVQRQSCLDQLIDGLSHYGVLSLLRENPSLRVLLDIPGEDKSLAADFVAGILKPSKVPAIGFHPTPKLIFIHDENKHLSIAHTCANELHLFVNATTMADDEFNYYFLVALMNGSLLEPDQYIGGPILSADIRHFPNYRYRHL